MKAEFNFKRPKKPFEIRFIHLFYFGAFLFTLFANITAGTWVASAYKTEVDLRVGTLEKKIEGLPEKLSSMEGKIDVILNNILKAD